MSNLKQEKVKKNLKSFEDQKLNDEAMKQIVGGTGGGSGQEDDDDGGNIISDDIIMP